jgi:hypothetical protein
MACARYYLTRRSAPQDERLALLPEHFFLGKVMLDIGCNEGWVTCEVGGSSTPPFGGLWPNAAS